MSDWTTMTWHPPDAWEVTKGRVARRLVFAADAWAAMPTRFEGDAAQRYRDLGGTGEFGAWWRDAVGGDAPGIRRFLIDADRTHWERAWEAIVAALPEWRRERVSIISRVGNAGQFAHRVAPREPLRVLVLQGAPGGEGLDTLDLDSEFREVLASYEGLDAAARLVAERPVALSADRANLVRALAEFKPGVLWLSGHADRNPPRFLLADGTWLLPAELAAAIREASVKCESVPLYVVLWACRSAAPARFGTAGAAPPFVEALCREGVAAVLGTMAPLADDAAIPAARMIFEGLAGGRPLDHAVARARSELLRAQEGSGRDDWACIVVWCADLPPPAVAWGTTGSAHAARQSLARRLLPDGWAPTEIDVAAAGQAAIWARQRRICAVSAAAKTSAVREAWISRLLATQKIVERHVLVFDFSDLSPTSAIRDWATRTLRLTDHLDDPDRWLRTIAAIAERSPEECWSALCQSDAVTLGMLDFPSDVDWLVQGLSAGAASAFLLAARVPADGAWEPDRILEDTGKLSVEMLENPLAQALAVLVAPADRGDIGEAVGTLPSWFDDAVVRMRDGLVMQLSLTERAATAMASSGRTQAHRLAFQLLNGPRARARLSEERAEELRKARLFHAREANLI